MYIWNWSEIQIASGGWWVFLIFILTFLIGTAVGVAYERRQHLRPLE